MLFGDIAASFFVTYISSVLCIENLTTLYCLFDYINIYM